MPFASASDRSGSQTFAQVTYGGLILAASLPQLHLENLSTGAFLSTLRGKTQSELARFLLTRGLWLVLLEVTVIRCLGGQFNFDYHWANGVVIWAIGWSMVALGGLIFLPHRMLVGFGLAMILGHNLLDKIMPERFGAGSWLWKILHVPGQLEPLPGVHFDGGYPLIPWIGVMAVGYGFGKLMLNEPQHRQKLLLRLGAVLTMSFVILRAVNVELPLNEVVQLS